MRRKRRCIGEKNAINEHDCNCSNNIADTDGSVQGMHWRKKCSSGTGIEASFSGIIPDETSANLNGTPIATISSPEKGSLFEAVLAIIILLAFYMIGWKRR